MLMAAGKAAGLHLRRDLQHSTVHVFVSKAVFAALNCPLIAQLVPPRRLLQLPLKISPAPGRQLEASPSADVQRCVQM